jgi:hypothetical protein
LVTAGVIAIANLYPARPYQASRSGASTNLDVIGAKVTVSEEGTRKVTVLQETIDLIGSLLENGWARPDKFVTVKLTKASDSKALKRQRVADVEEFKTIELFKGLEATYPFQGKDVKITHDDMGAEWALTFPEKVKVKKGKKTVEVDRFDSPDFEAVLAGNRALSLAVLVHNTVARKAGKTDAIITHVERECRDYGTADNRDRASIFLNEEAKLGKLAPSKLQRLGASFSMVERGAIEAHLRTIFAAGKKQRGDIQVHYKVPAVCAFLKRLDKDQTVKINGKAESGAAAYDIVKGWLLDGDIHKPTAQGNNLKGLNILFNIVTHAEGLTEAFAKMGGDPSNPKRPAYGVLKGKTLNAVETKKRIRDNPKLAQMVADFFSNRRNKEWVNPLLEGGTVAVKSMGSTEITTACAEIEEGLIQTLAMTCAGEDTGHDLVDILKACQELVEKVYLLDTETGEPMGDHLTPADMPEISKRLGKATKKKSSGRQKKTG